MNYLKDMTNEELKDCLLKDMEMLRDGSWVVICGDDSIDATVLVIEEVFRRVDILTTEFDKRVGRGKLRDPHALSNKLITNALKRGDI
tara:strand:- start:165 stop:428 length:264 start_codon:yes stop_codon:yes gene_type:complete